MKIGFCGGCEEVGASCVLLRVEERNLLLDSGIRLGSRDRLPDFRLVQEMGGVDAIVVSHAHMDHSGSLPVISREYPRAPIFTTPAARDIIRVLLHDSLKIMDREEDVPAYAPGHVEEMLERIRVYGFQNPFHPFDDRDIEITLFQAGHILGAACVYLTSVEGAVFYSGDLSVTPQRTVPGVGFPRLRPDVLILESTYGERLHANRKVEEQRLVEIVAEVADNGGKILIPAFAVGRAQEVILILRSAVNRGELPPLPIYVDGMVRDILALYRQHPNALRPDLAKRILRGQDVFYSGGVEPVDSLAMRRGIVEGSESCCIVSSSGMLSGGPSSFYAERLARSDRNLIAITGYQDEEAPGRKLLDLLATPVGEERVWQVSGASVPVACRMGVYGLSAHADRGELLGVVQALSPRRAFLVHGSPTALEELGRALQPLVRGDVYVPRNGESFDIALRNPRRQVESEAVVTLDQSGPPGEEGLRKLWEYLKDRPRKAGYTAEELLRIWSERLEVDEDELAPFRGLLQQESFFQADRRRLFLYHPLPEEEVQVLPQVMEVNEMLALAERFFPADSGLYRKGARFEEKIVLLSFNFPVVEVSRCADRLEAFAKETGWKVETNSRCNISALKPLLARLLEGDRNLLEKVSFFEMQQMVRAEMSAAPSKTEGLGLLFQEATGLELDLEYPGKETPICGAAGGDEERSGETSRMEQNAALTLISRAFEAAPHRLYRKGIKSDGEGRYIELAFISPQVGKRYLSTLEELEAQSGWRIAINPNPNQNELINKALELAEQAGVAVTRNPSVRQFEGRVCLRFDGTEEDEPWSGVQARYLEETGFDLARE